VVTLLWVGLGAALAVLAVRAAAWCARRLRAASATVDRLLDLPEEPDGYSGTPHCPVTPETGNVVDCDTLAVPSDV
jgi:hypothetical protein